MIKKNPCEPQKKKISDNEWMPRACCAVTSLPLCVLFLVCFMCLYLTDEGGMGKKKGWTCKFKNCNLDVPPNPRKAVSAET